jgi:NDP-sugar pyrophosphorylase family protein
MRAILLAAGKGTRFGEITKHIPKSLLPVGGIPLIFHTLNALPNEVSECSIVVEHLGNQIRSEVGVVHKNRKITYIQQEYPGTGGALLSAQEMYKDESSFLVVGTDDLFGKNELKKLLSFCPSYGVVHQSVPKKYQNREPVLDNSGHLIGFRPVQSGGPILCGAGAYVLSSQVFSRGFHSLTNGELSIPDTVAMSATRAKAIFLSNWIPINDQEERILAEKLLEANPEIFP